MDLTFAISWVSCPQWSCLLSGLPTFRMTEELKKDTSSITWPMQIIHAFERGKYASDSNEIDVMTGGGVNDETTTQ